VDIIEVIENNPIPWTVKTFAAAMGVSTDQVYGLVKAGKLPALTLGSKILLDPKRTADCLRERMMGAVSPPEISLPWRRTKRIYRRRQKRQ
jgi:excisionase family DNA binding protein